MLAGQFFTKLAKPKVSTHNNRINTMLITFGVFGLKCNWFGKVGRQHVLCKRYSLEFVMVIAL
ncbi:hypothetical protein C9I99_26720 [Photobacterium lutimaris]|uniref:Uncharacterized protein n=1 Tax=Photobacterium lutimaris TaxID=388278 RepID=A0A2T3IHN8_9GAMM|nr:hypothetical protein C9I99_26720 [Photobacterium lutimaris]